MKINYNIPKINQILRDLSTLTGTIICFADADFKNITGRGCQHSEYCEAVKTLEAVKNNELCNCFDQELYKHCKESGAIECRMCHGGLYNIGMPILKNDVIAGYIQIGSLRTDNSTDEPPYAEASGVKLQKFYERQPYFEEDQLKSLISLLPNILFENAITIEYDSFISSVTDYIHGNIRENITIHELCSRFHVSKSYLYESFREYYQCTVNEYIAARRIAEAKNYLKNTNEPVYRIAELIGIENYTYFCKFFKAKTGMSPGEYRRKVKDI